MPARSLHDTRLLSNLIKTEKDAQSSSVLALYSLAAEGSASAAAPSQTILTRFLHPHDRFKAWTKDANSASAALSAWSVADSGNTQDLMVSSRACALGSELVERGCVGG